MSDCFIDGQCPLCGCDHPNCEKELITEFLEQLKFIQEIGDLHIRDKIAELIIVYEMRLHNE